MTITYVPVPFTSTTLLFGSKFPLTEAKEAKEITVELYAKTKTRLSLSLRHGQQTINANHIPEDSKNLKFHTERVHSYFSGSVYDASYFVVSKKQGKAALENHIKNVVAEVFELPKDADFTIKIQECRVVKALPA